MKCIACDKLLNQKELAVSCDYCHICLAVIAEDLIEVERERLLRELKNDES